MWPCYYLAENTTGEADDPAFLIRPTRFTGDTRIQALEIRPGNRTLMHHAVLYERTPDSKWLREYPVGVPFVPAPRPGQKQRSSDGDRTSEGSLADEWLVGYVPGAPPNTLPPSTAFLVKAADRGMSVSIIVSSGQK